MVVIEVDDKLNYVEKRLGDLSNKAPKVICKSINETAKWARAELAKEAQKTYLVKSGQFNKNMKIENARYSNLEATIKSQGAPMELYAFKYSVGKKATKAQVLKSGSLKKLEKSGIRAFVAKFASGHRTIAQRQGKERLPIKVLFSNSIPKMLGNEKRVYGVVRPEIQKELNKRIKTHIKKVLEGYE